MRELKWTPGQSAELSGLGNGESRRTTVTILELSGKRLRLGAEQPVTGGAAVRLEWEGQMVLGQVLNAQPGGFWMEIHHVLLDTASLQWQQQGWHRG